MKVTDLLLAGTSLAHFQAGDTSGKSDAAVLDAIYEGAKHAGARKALYALQAAVGGLPEVNCPLQHDFAPGVYMRTIFIPAGVCIVGKIHRHRHGNILSQGHVRVFTEGGGVEELKGPLTMVSEPGTKRAVHALTDTVWTTIHPTDETDLEKIEEQVIAKTYEEYEQSKLEGSTMSAIEVNK